MTGDLRSLVLLAATLTTGLMAGLYFAFSVAVMPGLARADDRTFIETMQRVNTAILNGWFTLAFGGALVLGVTAAVLHRSGQGRPALPWIIAGVVLYTASLVITMGFNVPLNNHLADAGTPAHIHDPAAVRERFETAWVHWNTARTLLTTGALGCLAWAMRTAGSTGRV
ncbi:anthrone oxygenase family protein [Streptomyces sp. NPDC006393]|uniref:anthrone oxygenase family protein n=1 Tax=Streptomyces sp. NPDC006393 TaxID=3156763 RepID=UPI00340063EC